LFTHRPHGARHGRVAGRWAGLDLTTTLFLLAPTVWLIRHRAA
jgi:hypothetical protein